MTLKFYTIISAQGYVFGVYSDLELATDKLNELGPSAVMLTCAGHGYRRDLISALSTDIEAFKSRRETYKARHEKRNDIPGRDFKSETLLKAVNRLDETIKESEELLTKMSQADTECNDLVTLYYESYLD